ncbi:hypothetical protein GQF03_16175 [Sneathiella chungangensis]|uniref:Uncharacterized protein n=1 Tax=Sneathiella chungangensis TaxID=1418234 RepID=A0A845MJL3_9PROT|nr:hypothetical protein [Sneathiella chungangensis]MZR23875.1 hypothetical protein [Sneathiella chungangensis]
MLTIYSLSGEESGGRAESAARRHFSVASSAAIDIIHAVPDGREKPRVRQSAMTI